MLGRGWRWYEDALIKEAKLVNKSLSIWYEIS